jgi:hypothetical protein
MGAMFLERQGSSRLSTAIATQKISITNMSAVSSAFGSQTYQIRVVADTACNIKIGDSGVSAGTSDALLPANWPEYFTVTPGQKIAVIGSSGLLYVSEIA